MSRTRIPPRERAARVLCRLEGKDPDLMIGGAYAWRFYTPQVDAVLRTVMGKDMWEAIVEAEDTSGLN